MTSVYSSVTFRPDHCDGTFDANCDATRAYTNITQILQSYGANSLLSYMQTYWKDYQGNDESFWEHEWAKHGTCKKVLSTFVNIPRHIAHSETCYLAVFRSRACTNSFRYFHIQPLLLYWIHTTRGSRRLLQQDRRAIPDASVLHPPEQRWHLAQHQQELYAQRSASGAGQRPRRPHPDHQLRVRRPRRDLVSLQCARLRANRPVRCGGPRWLQVDMSRQLQVHAQERRSTNRIADDYDHGADGDESTWHAV